MRRIDPDTPLLQLNQAQSSILGFFPAQTPPNEGAARNLYRADLGRRGRRAAIPRAPRTIPGPACRACHGHLTTLGGRAFSERSVRACPETLFASFLRKTAQKGARNR